MIGRQSRQMAMIFVDIESLIPENHLLRKIDRMVSFDFINAAFILCYIAKSGKKTRGFFPDFAFCQQVQLLTVP